MLVPQFLSSCAFETHQFKLFVIANLSACPQHQLGKHVEKVVDRCLEEQRYTGAFLEVFDADERHDDEAQDRGKLHSSCYKLKQFAPGQEASGRKTDDRKQHQHLDHIHANPPESPQQQAIVSLRNIQ